MLVRLLQDKDEGRLPDLVELDIAKLKANDISDIIIADSPQVL